MVALVVIAAAVVGYLCYAGTFYVTGKQWFEACYERSIQKEAREFATKEPVSPDPYKQLLWANCETLSGREMFDAGLLFAGGARDDSDDDGRRLLQVCPSTWSDLPMGGTYFLSLKLLQASGGPNWLDRFLPADAMIGRVYTAKWPRCNSERARQGPRS